MWQLEVKLDSSFDKMCLYWLLPVLLKKILTWHQHILCTSNYILLTSSSEERIFVVKIAPLQIKILQNIVGNFSNSPSPTLFSPNSLLTTTLTLYILSAVAIQFTFQSVKNVGRNTILIGGDLSSRYLHHYKSFGKISNCPDSNQNWAWKQRTYLSKMFFPSSIYLVDVFPLQKWVLNLHLSCQEMSSKPLLPYLSRKLIPSYLRFWYVPTYNYIPSGNRTVVVDWEMVISGPLEY